MKNLLAHKQAQFITMNSELGLPDNDRAIKGLVDCWDLLNLISIYNTYIYKVERCLSVHLSVP